MAINFARLGYLPARLVRGRLALADIADRAWEVSPQERKVAPPAIYLEGQLSRVISVQEASSFEVESMRVQGGIVSHAPTMVYRVPKAKMRGAYLYTGTAKLQVGYAKENAFVAPPNFMAEGALACTVNGSRYFGHWLTDDIPLHLLAAQYGEPVGVDRRPYGHEPNYVAKLGVSVSALASANFGHLYVFEDYSQNQSKRVRYADLRARMSRALESPIMRNGVMLLRGASGQARVLENEEEIAALCEARGFAVLDPQKASVEELVSAIQGAKVVAGVEGSQLLHAVYALPTGGVVMTLQPPYRFCNVIKDYADCLGLHYAFVVGTQSQGGFTVCSDAFLRTLDLAEKVAKGATSLIDLRSKV